MNKYFEALLSLRYFYAQAMKYKKLQKYNCKNQFDILKELVDRATPKKPETSGDSFENGHLIHDTWYCPNCDENFEIDYNRYEYCPCCGQAIDNSELDEMR